MEAAKDAAAQQRLAEEREKAAERAAEKAAKNSGSRRTSPRTKVKKVKARKDPLRAGSAQRAACRPGRNRYGRRYAACRPGAGSGDGSTHLLNDDLLGHGDRE